MEKKHKTLYELGRDMAISLNGEDGMEDDGTLEYNFPAEWLKGYRETLVAIRLIKQHGVDKVFGVGNA